jgi:hypothetical protein
VDQEVTEALITAVTELVTQGAFDNLERPKYGYAELSRSRMGWDADVELSEMITEDLSPVIWPGPARTESRCRCIPLCG